MPAEEVPLLVTYRREDRRAEAPGSASAAGRRSLRHLGVLLGPAALVTVLYLSASVLMWWEVWSRSPGATMTCECGDPAWMVGFLSWPAYAIAHGHNPFFSTWFFHPDGVNLLANTGITGEGIALAPVTWLFGPVATLNVALTAAPALSALAAYGCLRHCFRLWRPAAFVAGLLYGLSPFVIATSAVGHLQTSMLAIPPVLFMCLYELIARPGSSPTRWGALLGLAVTVQFFFGTEILAICAVVAAAAGLLLCAAAAATNPALMGQHFRHAVVGLATAGAVAGLLLAWPVWFALDGPQHLTGLIWPVIPNGVNSVASFWRIHDSPAWGPPLVRLSGYEGALGSSGVYMGLSGLAAAAAAVVLVRRPAVRFSAVMFVVVGVLSLGGSLHWSATGGATGWLPWRLAAHLPIVENIIPANFSAVLDLFYAMLVGFLLDDLWRRRRDGALAIVPARVGLHRREDPGGLRRPYPLPAVAVGALLALVGAAVLVPWARAWPVPLTTARVTVPQWYATDAMRLPPTAVVLSYPDPEMPPYNQAIVWQAEDGMHYRMATGFGLVPGPDGKPDKETVPGTAEGTLGALTSPLVSVSPPRLTDEASMDTVRRAMRRWGVTTVVVSDGGRDPGYAARWFTNLLGRRPLLQDGSRVWYGVDTISSSRG